MTLREPRPERVTGALGERAERRRVGERATAECRLGERAEAGGREGERPDGERARGRLEGGAVETGDTVTQTLREPAVG